MSLPETMKAAVVLPGPFPEVRNIPLPHPKTYEVLGQTLACGICSSTDLRVCEGRLPFHGQYPAVLGHEGIARVIQPAADGDWEAGSLFTRGCAVWPGSERDGLYSGWGSMADFVLARDPGALTRHPVPDEPHGEYASQQSLVPSDLPVEVLVLSISLAEVHSWMSALGPLAGKRIVILGTGFVGYAMLLFARLAGAESIVMLGRRESRLAKARVLGATDGLLSSQSNPAGVQAALGGAADFLLEASGDADALASYLGVVGPRGKIAAYGIPDSGAYSLPLGSMHPEASFMAPRPREAESLPKVLELLRQGALPTAHLLSHLWRWPQDVPEAFEAVRRGDVLKGVLVWPDEGRG